VAGGVSERNSSSKGAGEREREREREREEEERLMCIEAVQIFFGGAEGGAGSTGVRDFQ